MKWLDTPIGLPILVWLTVVFFVAASISTFDLRLTQAKRAGTVPADEPMLPQMDRGGRLVTLDSWIDHIASELEIWFGCVCSPVYAEGLTGA